MQVEIFSDVVCPWCYLGRARFAKAVQRFEGDVEVTWRAFQLDPGGPATPEPLNEYLARKFGGPERVAEMHERMKGLARAEDLELVPERALRVNTLDAHRVLWLAGQEGIQDAVAERLFRAHHTEGRDIADHASLAELGVEAGLGIERVRSFLAGTEGVAEVRAELERARDLGITGVPLFLFEDTWAVPGAQETSTFLSALHEVAARTESSP